MSHYLDYLKTDKHIRRRHVPETYDHHRHH